MTTYKDCPECGARKIHATVRLCEVCETWERAEAALDAQDEVLTSRYNEQLARAERAERERDTLIRADLAVALKERDEARELIANLFDRYACAMCSHGKTGPDCPCGCHAAGAYLDRTVDEMFSGEEK